MNKPCTNSNDKNLPGKNLTDIFLLGKNLYGKISYKSTKRLSETSQRCGFTPSPLQEAVAKVLDQHFTVEAMGENSEKHGGKEAKNGRRSSRFDFF